MTVQAVEAFSPYSNITALWTEGLPTWMDSQDAQRILSYQIYEQIYWNVPDTFKLVMRGEENTSPIYIPTARTIVDTTSRYIGASPGILIDDGLGTPEEQLLCRRAYQALFRRERFWSKYNANKLYGVMRGDWVWHILANPAKPQWSRIKIEAIDPAAYFPVTHPDDPDRIIAVHIVEQVRDEQDQVFIRRQTYQRGADPVANDGSDETIYNSIGLFNVDAWQEMSINPVTVVKEITPLPAQIKSIPVYHIRNIEAPGDPYGSSELRGFERVMAAVNQAISDEELALALEGLGMYSTDGGPPRNEAGQITDWVLGPGRVVEHTPGSDFKRINGVNSVDPVQNHITMLVNALREAAGVPEAATGKVDVDVAESGVALMMQLAPLLAKADVRNDAIADVHNQMFYDLRGWLSAYEQFDTPCIPEIVFGGALPENRTARIKEILDIVAAQVADIEWAQEQLAQFGYVFPNGAAGVLNEQAARAKASDPFAARMDQEFEEAEGDAG